MPLAGNVTRAAPGLLGFDTAASVNAASAAILRNKGFSFALRYLSRGNGQNPGDLSPAEANRLLAAGIGLMPVQHFEGEGWVPSEALGSQYGRNAAANAGAIGFPQGINVWVDLEGVSAHTPAANVVAYCNAWSDEVEGAGFVPGVYVGPGAGLSSDDLFFRLKTKHYWRAGAASTPDVSHRGFQLFQSLPHAVDGLGFKVDSDVAKDDQLGDAVMYLSP